MPKGFSDEEKTYLKNKLLDTGIEIFGKYGIRKTTVEDITRAAGIAKGSFYLFFESKEEFFMQTGEYLEARFRSELLNTFPENAPQKELFKQFLIYQSDLTERYPIINIIFDKEEYEYLLRKLPRERAEAHMNKDDDFVETLVSQWCSSGEMKNIDPKTVSGIIRAVFFLNMHKDEIGNEVFPQVIETIANSLADKLFN